MLKTALLVGTALVGCTDTPTAGVRVSMSSTSSQSLVSAAPMELSVKMTAVYVTEDKDAGTGSNIGRTQAVYASPECEGIGGEGIQAQPNLGNCSIDVGLQSSSSPP